MAVLLFSGQLASWLSLLAIAIVYSILKGKDSLAVFTLVSGTVLTFTIESHLTGSAYFLLGSVGYAIQPAIEAVRNGLQIYTVTTTFLAALFLYYFLTTKNASPTRTLIVSSIVVFFVYISTYLWLGVYTT
jgi:hypothetical protein